MGIFSKTVRATLNGGAAPQSDGPGDPIVDWTTSGTARWMIDASGCLTIAPLEGEESGELEDWRGFDKAPWYDNSSLIISVKIEGAIVISTATGMFYGCSSLKFLDLSSFDAWRAMDMSRMFEGCSSLKFLDLPSLDAPSVTDMSRMFYGCSSLASLDLPRLDASKVTDMSLMFCGCSSLKFLDLSSLGASSVTDMSSMFSGCSSLASLDLSGLGASKVTDMSEMFEGCFALRTVVLGLAFSFQGYGSYLPTPRGESLTGKWLSSADGKAYAPEAVPNNVAATYTAQAKADISGAVISGVPAKMTATGSQLAPKPVVTFNGERLVEGRDYIVSYGENVEPSVGAGSVTVSAVEDGNFTGFVTVFFDIEKKITFPDVDYDND